MEFTITKEQIERLIKMAEHGSTNVIKADLKNWFPEAFKKELEVGKWYKIKFYTGLELMSVVTQIQYNKICWFGFRNNIWINSDWSDINIINQKSSFTEATDKEVEEALIAEAKKRGFVEGVKTKGFDDYSEKSTLTNGFSYYVNENILKANVSGNFYTKRNIFKDGVWAKILPEEKTTISKEKALKIIAKKLKVSPENIEIK